MNINIFCLPLLECLWKIFIMIMICRSIQYLRVIIVFIKELNSNNENQSSTFLVIHVILNNIFVNKQFNV